MIVALLLACGPKAVLPPVPAAPESWDAIDPVAVLADGAESIDPSARAHALAWLVRTDPEPGAPSWAQRGLWDPEPWVQRQVVEALAARDEDASDAVLLGYVRRDVDPYVRASAGMRLRAHEVAVTDVFGPAWRAETASWRVAPLALVAAASGDAEAVAPLSKALSKGEVGLELEFFDDIAASGLVALVEPLRAGSEWVEPELLLPYASARLRLGDADAADVLRHALAADGAEDRLAALDIVTGLPAAAAVPLLHKARAGDDAAGWYAALALAALDDGDATKILQGAGFPEREVRQQAARFAGQVGPERPRRDQKAARDALRVALADDDAEVRRTAIASVGVLGLDGEEPWLRSLLADDDPAVRVEAAGVLLGSGSDSPQR